MGFPATFRQIAGVSVGTHFLGKGLFGSHTYFLGQRTVALRT